ncbi:MAG: chemotaxis protein CheW [Chromatiaceae bacterium]|nr:chemotaxis protein CheW [Chromatiaceae bacterium]
MRETPGSGAEFHALIAQLDASCRAQRRVLPHDAPPPDSWAAVLYRVRDQRFLSPLEEIAEVLEVPGDITRIPGTRPWFVGVANNRGTLLPIYDLGALIQGGLASRRAHPSGQPRARDRVLVVRQSELPCGLIVSETIGMRHVPHAERVPGVPSGLGPSAPYVESSFRVEGDALPLLHLDRLIADPLFNAALN